MDAPLLPSGTTATILNLLIGRLATFFVLRP
jgi:hypothetical protein